MKFRRPFVLFITGPLALAGCDKGTTTLPETRTAAPARIDPVRGHLLQAQPTLPTMTVFVGTNALITEVARRPVEIATGMMFRTNLLENEAMLFVFQGTAQRSFYMRNCVVPLSAAYISPTGEILQIARLDPGDERGVLSFSDEVQFVLEVRQGWFERHATGVGSFVRTDRGSLQETFFESR